MHAIVRKVWLCLNMCLRQPRAFVRVICDAALDFSTAAFAQVALGDLEHGLVEAVSMSKLLSALRLPRTLLQRSMKPSGKFRNKRTQLLI